MRVWRLALGRHGGLDSEGARLYGGRWNSPGVPVVYTATHLSLALLEQLVHVSPERLPTAVRAFAIDIPDSAPVEHAPTVLDPNDAATCRHHGDRWLEAGRSAALIVPSVMVPAQLDPHGVATEERNVLLNPHHDSAGAWRAVETSFRIDPRLKRTAPSPGG